MSALKQSSFGSIIIISVLGSTEGSLYYSDGSIVDKRTFPTMPPSNSGLSYGLTQLDVANNPAAYTLFNQMLSDAVAGNRITQAQANDYLTRADTVGLYNSSQAFTTSEINTIQTQVFNPDKSAIEAADSVQIQNVLNSVDTAIDASTAHWGTPGVFSTTDPDNYLAIGQLASWSNRTNGLSQMQTWLTGGTVAGVTTLTHAPTIDDINNYLKSQKEFVDHPGEFDGVTQNIKDSKQLVPILEHPSSEQLLKQYLPFQYTPWIDTATEHFIQSLHLVSPLILDLNGNGFEVSNLNGAAPSTVYFDMNNDGHPVRTGWVSGGDGLLCIDRNSNGTIDNQSELFGNNATYANGFLNLGQYDSNHDGQITSADAQFAALRVWTDTNQDGVSQAAELHTLSDLGITAISLSTTAHSNTYVADNTETVTSTFTMNGVTQAIGDLWFRSDTSDSYAVTAAPLDSATLFLPELRGYGLLPDLAAAMTADTTLKGLVQSFQNGWSNAVLANPAGLDTAVQNILFRWAGVDGVSPNARDYNGNHYIDARILEFVEHLTGTPYIGNGNNPNPSGASPVAQIMDAWYLAFDAMKAQIVVQAGGGASLFDTAPIYDPASGTFTGASALSASAITALGTQGAGLADSATKLAYWTEIADVLQNVKPSGAYTSTEISEINSAITASGLTGHSWTDISAAALSHDGTITVSDDNLSGHLATGPNGGTLYGNGGDDVLIGAYGNTWLEGDAGNDTYIFTPGSSPLAAPDSINGESTTGGTDTVVLTGGIHPADVHLWTDAYSLHLSFTATDDVAARGTSDGSSDFIPTIEKVVFDDGTVWSLTGTGLHINDTDDSHTALHGTQYNDVIDSHGGNDTMYGGLGDDTYVFGMGYGHDVITESGGNDTLHVVSGLTINDLTFADAGNYNTLISITGGTDNVTIANERGGGIYPVENIVFDDGFHATLTSYSSWISGTAGNDMLTGTANADVMIGKAGNDTISAGAGNDWVHGGAGNDTIDGGAGNDWLWGGTGINALTGGTGADHFMFDVSSITTGTSSTISDFHTSEGDTLDISHLIAGYDPVSSAIADFVQLTTSGSNTLVSVDADGPGTAHAMQQIATLTGVTGLDIHTLLANGNLIATS